MNEPIYNQTRIPRYRWRYGLRASAAVGCGWIAVYNALHLMGYEAKPAALIRSFTRQLPILNGPLGTFFLQPALYLKKQGFPVTVSVRRKRFDALVKESRACVLFYYWRRRHRLGAHFVALQYRDGNVMGYNTFRNSTGPDNYGPSLTRFLRKQKYFFPVLTAIRDKRESE